MKKFFILLPLVAFIGLNTGCDNATEVSATDADSAAVLAPGMKVFDLSGHPVAGLPLVMNVPDENTGVAEVTESPMGGTQVKVGKDFNIEILPGGGDINAKKEEINSNGLFKNTFIVDEADVLMYSSEIEGSDIRQYHFYVVRDINGNKYEMWDAQDGTDYSQEGIKQMVESAKTLRRQDSPAS